MTTRHDAPKPIGPARAHELVGLSAPDRHYAGGCPYCRGLGRTGAELDHAVESCERVAAGAVEDPLLGMQALEEASMRRSQARGFPSVVVVNGEQVVEQKLAACRRIRRALDDDREARVLGMITARPAWLPWSPLGDGRHSRRLAQRQLVRDLALLVAATATVWLVFVAAWQAWP